MRGSAALRTGVAPGGALAGPWVQNPLWTAARAVPSLDLRFADNKSLVDATTGQNLVTFTRASSGTYIDSAGVIQTAATDVPRFDHNPTTGESLGLLVEEQRTNLAVQSNTFTTTWSPSAVTLTSGATVSPDGTTNAWLLADTAVNTFHNLTQSIAWTATAYTCSVYAKFNTHRWISIRIGAVGNQFFGSWDLQNGVVGSATAGATVGMQAAGNGWYRLTLTATLSTAASANLLIQLANVDSTFLNSYTGTATSSWIYGVQLEQGAFATSVIPTTAAAVTRSADVASITGSAFSGWYRQDEGTVFAEAQLARQNATAGAAMFGIETNASNAEAIYMHYRGSGATAATVFAGSAGQADFFPYSSAVPANTVIRQAIGVRANDMNAAGGGAIGATDTSCTMPTPDRMLIGFSTTGTKYLSGTIRRLVYWGQRLPNNVLQAITQ